MKNQLGQLALEQAKTFGGKLEVQVSGKSF